MVPGRLDRLPTFRIADDAVIHQAETFASRLLGLALLPHLPAGHALLIPDCLSVHTFGMRFRIDVAFLDERGRVLRVGRSVGAWRVLVCRRAFAVLEARAGEIDRYLGKGGTAAH